MRAKPGEWVRFSLKSGRIDTVTVESGHDPERTFSRICGSAGGCGKPGFCVQAEIVVRPVGNLLIKQRGKDAPIFAATQADKRADGSDVESKPL